jgi:hypothetical protein
LLSCTYENSNGDITYSDFKIGREGNSFYAYSGGSRVSINETMTLGDTSAGIGYLSNPEKEETRGILTEAKLANWSGSHADRVIVRKKKGSAELEIFPSNCWKTKAEIEKYGIDRNTTYEYFGDNGVRRIVIPLNADEKHPGTLTIGAPKRYIGSTKVNSDNLCHASISGLKIWKIALSDIEVTKAANYPKERLRFWLTEFPRINAHKSGRNQYSLTNNDTVGDNLFPGVILELRDFLKNSRYFEGTVRKDITDSDGQIIKTEYITPKNYEGWMATATREWLNTRIKDAFPAEWRAAIKPVKVFQLVGTPLTNADGEVVGGSKYNINSNYFDSIFNPSYQEYVPTDVRTNPYNLEAVPSSIAYTNESRRKFYEVAGKWYTAFNRTRSPLDGTTGFWRIAPAGGLDGGTSPNYKAWVTFAFCV